MNIKAYDRFARERYWHIIAGLVGYSAGFVVFWFFYQVLMLSLIGGLAFIPIAIMININTSKKRRLAKVLTQFRSLLESLAVSLASGSSDLNAFNNTLGDLHLMYGEDSDIAKEVTLIIQKFNNSVSIGDALLDFAHRTGLEDVKLFGDVYKAVEGKGEKTREIVLRTQKVLTEKIAIKQEITTISAGAVSELNIMVTIPIFIVAAMGTMGGEMMQGLFTPTGRVAATLALLVFGFAYYLGKKIVDIKV